MVQLIKPSQVVIQTTQGELKVSIVLDLNINLNADGITVSGRTPEVAKEELKESTEWAIPDFENTKIKFGKY